MDIFYTIKELKQRLAQVKDQGKSLGFVPTMGALHHGHLSLIAQAKKENDLVLCSIFVNPTQFNDKKDLEKYPRTLDNDKLLLIQGNCDLLFVPTVDEMYAGKETSAFDFGLLDKSMEGLHRPGHFNGVGIIVEKFLNIVQPNAAYFGQKDFQQLLIVKQLVEDLELPVRIVDCPTFREADGLAMSSRNVLLSAEERKLAPLISKVLFALKQMSREQPVAELISWVSKEIKKNPFMQLEYFEIVNARTLAPVADFKDASDVVACIAVKLGKVRLIDNIILFP